MRPIRSKNFLTRIGLGLLVFLLLLKAIDALFPLKNLNAPERFSRVVLDEQGRVLRAFADHNGVWRYPITLDQVSENYLDALIGYEDQWFWFHPGVNPVAFMRALVQNIQCNCVVSGGSTITMQVARIFYPNDRTIAGKLKQIARALQLEWHFSKEEILTLYINNAPFGGTFEGVQAASQTYLQKNASDLTDAEAALLAVLPQSPSRYRPDRHADVAREARDKLLDRMTTHAIWSAQRVKHAKQEIVYANEPKRPMLSPILARQLVTEYPDHHVIPTYINLDLQQSLGSYIADRSHTLPQKSSIAVLVLDNKTSQIKAHVATADFGNHDRYGYVDMVNAIRSPGSTLKPFIYGLAIDDGLIHSHSLLIDAPRLIGDYRPENFNSRFNGAVSTTFALQKSLNLPALQVLEALGPDYVYAKLKNAGVPLVIPGKPNLAIALGGAGASLKQLVALYSALANSGQVIEPIETPLKSSTTSRYLFSKDAAWITYKMLASAPRPDRLHGSLFLDEVNPIAWKTGTSYGFRDSWAIGVTQNTTIGVWVGRPDGTPLPGHFGAATAAPILFEIFESLPKRQQALMPSNNISVHEVCWPLGRLKAQTDAEHCHQTKQAWIKNNQVPPTLPEPGVQEYRANPYTIWLNANTQRLVSQECHAENKVAKRIALWPRVVEPWLAQKYRFHSQLPEVDESCAIPPFISARPLTISTLEKGSKFRITEDSERFNLELSAVGGQGTQDWYIDGMYIGSTLETHTLNHELTETGSYEVVVLDRQGDVDRVEIQLLK